MWALTTPYDGAIIIMLYYAEVMRISTTKMTLRMMLPIMPITTAMIMTKVAMAMPMMIVRGPMPTMMWKLREMLRVMVRIMVRMLM